MNTNSRRSSSTSRITLSVLAVLASAATADARTVAEWDLPVQPLADSLRAVAAQSDSNILFDKSLVDGQSARPLKMRATAPEALHELLDGTGLVYRQLDDRTMTIQSASASSGASLRGTEGRIRLAQASTGQGGGETPPMVDGRPLFDIEEIIVTGTNIRGVENETAPVTVLSRQYIDATGYSTVSKLLESVTQNFALANQSGINTPNVSGNNREQGSAINLRGVGEGTTLVLLNGRRLAPGYRSAAVDISALPLSAIERVEILPDGASALYGSDAVGGVVNFILRDDFEGAETRLRGGAADGVNEYRASQAVGNSWDSGNFLASVEYYKRDMLLAADRDFVPRRLLPAPQPQILQPLVGSLAPEDQNYSAIVTARQDLSGSVSVFADLLYSDRDSFNRAGRVQFNEQTDTQNVQGVGTLGVDWNVAGDWQIEVAGSYARNDIDQLLIGNTAAGLINNVQRDMVFTIEAGEVKADGSLFSMPGGQARAAIGAAWRSESYEDVSRNVRTGAVLSQKSDQTIRSAFGELYLPLVGKDNAIAGVNRLDLSMAGRYDDYSSAGSSFDPQAGLMWEPVAGFKLRGRYSMSYKAPNLVEYNFGGNSVQAFNSTALGPQLQVLQVFGTDVDSLEPQESESASFGMELAPESLRGLTVALNYYKIRYTGQVATPGGTGASSVIFGNLPAYQDIVYLTPSVDLVNQFIAIGQLGGRALVSTIPNFTPAMVDVIVDTRRRNLSVVRAEGVDLSLQYAVDVGESSNLLFGLNGTYILDQEQQVTDTSPAAETVDTIYNPPNWRARGLIGWQMQGWAANLFVNRTDSYTDNRALPAPLPRGSTIDAYTTVDLRLAYDFSKRFTSGVLSGFSVALNAQNVLDEDPPSVLIANNASPEAGFDATNADPLGRIISLEFTKTW